MEPEKKSKFKLNKQIISVLLLLVLNILIFLLIHLNTSFPSWYNENIFGIVTTSLGGASSALPFSLFEILMYVMVLCILYSIIAGTIRICKREEKASKQIQKWCFSIVNMVLLLFLVYNLTCGVNYYAPSFATRNDINAKDYSVEELEALCRKMTTELLEIADQVPRDSANVMYLTTDIEERVRTAIARLSLDFNGLEMIALQPKPFINSWLMSYLQISGFYSPFTIEANYNKDMVAYNLPFTMLHELAHTMGYMKEDEANFIAYLACLQSTDVELQYSGALLGWIYATNLLKSYDEDTYLKLRSRLSKDIEADLQMNSMFWARYEGELANMQETVNDTYLKWNQQEDGVKSYGRMVDLIYAYRMQEDM